MGYGRLQRRKRKMRERERERERGIKGRLRGKGQILTCTFAPGASTDAIAKMPPMNAPPSTLIPNPSGVTAPFVPALTGLR